MQKNILRIGVFLVAIALGPAAHGAGASASGDNGRSGSRGQDGLDGSRGSWGRDGSDGRDGERGRNGQNGGHAGSISTYASVSQDGVLDLEIEVGGRTQSGQYAVGSVGKIFLRAAGGNGGSGGRGGDGGDGGRGGDGNDATRYRSGEDGGDGGRGGDGGDGGRGGDGGDGGQVTVEVAEHDTDLLMLFEVDVRGGSGGSGGPGGRGGSGGSGGSGGDSYTWYEDEPCDTDPDGTCSTRRYNFGGSSGKSGSDGRAGMAGANGRDGRRGQYTIRVHGPNGTATYSSIYDLRLVDFTLVEEYPDGVLEPGERFSLEDLTLQNVGGMPSPSATKTHIFLVSRDHVLAEPQELELTQSIAVGERFTLTGQRLDFRVSPAIFENPEQSPLDVTQTVDPEAMMGRVNQKFAKFHAGHRVQVRFPVEIEPITPGRSVLPGESVRLLYKVTNRSNKSFGSRAEIQREIKLALKRTGGDLDPASVEAWFTGGGGPLDLDHGILRAIENLGPGKSVLVEFEVHISEDAEVLTDVQINLGLDYEILDRGTQRVQNKTTHLRVSQVYRAREESSAVLVVNPGMSNELILAWKTLMERSGLKTDIWDLDIYGHLNLTYALNKDQSFADSLRGKTLIVPTNTWAESGGASATNFLQQQELVRTFASHQLSLFLVGPNSPELEEWILPFYSDRTRNYRNSHEFLTDIGSVDQHIQVGDQVSVPVRKGFWRFRGNNWSDQRADQLLANLAKRYPDQRYFIVTPVKEWKAKQVDLVAVRGLDRRTPAGVAQSLTQEQTLDPSWVLEGGPLLGMALSMSFDQKLPLLAHTLGSFAEDRTLWLQVLMTAMTHDFLLEQQIVGQNEHFPIFNARMVTDHLTFLDNFLEFGLVRPAALPEFVDEYLLEVFGTVRFFSEEMVSFWERFQVRSVDRALRRQTVLRIDDVLSSWLGSRASRRDVNQFRSRLMDVVHRQRAVLKSTKNWRRYKEDLVHAMVMAPFSDLAIGQNMYDSRKESVISVSDWNQLKEQYQTRDAAVPDFASDYQRKRASLLRP